MRKMIWIGMLTLAVIACGTGADMMGEIMDSGVPDAGAQPTPKPVGKFVGYSSEAHRLNPQNMGGQFNIYAACQADFGATARICTVTDVLGTLDLPAPPPEGDGQNVLSGAWLIANNLDGVPLCWNEGASSITAPYITQQGGFQSDSCTRLRVLACCTVE